MPPYQRKNKIKSLHLNSNSNTFELFQRPPNNHHSIRLPIPPLSFVPLQSSTRSCSSFGRESSDDTEPSSCCPSPIRPLASSSSDTPPLPNLASNDPLWFLRIGKEKHHPYPPRLVPYWLSYQPEVIDHHILMMYAASPEPFTILGAPTAGPFSVLDLACGPTAPWSIGALALNPHRASFTALDICPLLLPRPLPSKLSFVQHDFLNAPLPFPDHTFNHVHVSFIACAVPEHQYAELLEEIKRVLRPQGALNILETNAIPNSVLEERFLTPYPLSILPAQLAMLGLARLERHQVKLHQSLLCTTRRAALDASRAWCHDNHPTLGNTPKRNLVELLGERFGWYSATDDSDPLKFQDQLVDHPSCSGFLTICQSEINQPRYNNDSMVSLGSATRHHHQQQEEMAMLDLKTRTNTTQLVSTTSSLTQTLKTDDSLRVSNTTTIGSSSRIVQNALDDVGEDEPSLIIESFVAYKLD